MTQLWAAKARHSVARSPVPSHLQRDRGVAVRPRSSQLLCQQSATKVLPMKAGTSSPKSVVCGWAAVQQVQHRCPTRRVYDEGRGQISGRTAVAELHLPQLFPLQFSVGPLLRAAKPSCCVCPGSRAGSGSPLCHRPCVRVVQQQKAEEGQAGRVWGWPRPHAPAGCVLVGLCALAGPAPLSAGGASGWSRSFRLGTGIVSCLSCPAAPPLCMRPVFSNIAAGHTMLPCLHFAC